MKIAITGATGFVGSHLVKYILENTDHSIVALSRSEIDSNHPRVKFVTCELYSFFETENALADCDIGIYLVHSMSPSSRLSQGNFQNFDFLLADNFAKAAIKNRLRHIIYVSGIVPKNEELSQHLLSRLEVENILSKHSVPTTTLRCGIVIGPDGSSFGMIKKLVGRLPLIIFPSWTKTKIQIISINDLVKVIMRVIEKKEEHSKIRSFDLAAPEVLTYASLIKKVAHCMKKKSVFISFPWVPLTVSRLWVSLITGYSKSLVYPLVQSLVHTMTSTKTRRLPPEFNMVYENTDKAILWSLNTENVAKLPFKKIKKYKPKTSHLVQSVQRLHCPEGWSMKNIANEYMNWLPQFLKPFLVLTHSEDNLIFQLRFYKKPLLILTFSEERTFSTRELFYITGGVLAKDNLRARLEFRKVVGQPYFIAAIHSFHPRLPWYIYISTQAIAHKIVMWCFGRHLKRV